MKRILIKLTLSLLVLTGTLGLLSYAVADKKSDRSIKNYPVAVANKPSEDSIKHPADADSKMQTRTFRAPDWMVES